MPRGRRPVLKPLQLAVLKGEARSSSEAVVFCGWICVCPLPAIHLILQRILSIIDNHRQPFLPV